jgi:hypothetical protein
MITSMTKLIAAVAISAGLLTNAAFAGHSGNGGGGGGGNKTGGNFKTSNVSAFKLNSTNTTSNNHPNTISGISKKPVTLSQTFKKQDFNFKKLDSNKDHKNSPLGISVNSLKKDNHSKDFFCKKDNKCWFDSCYSKNCWYPYYFGCYYPIYSCYDYCVPTYTTCSYTCASLPVVENVQPSRTLVSVGSILMINGQVFGNQAGGARLRLNGMAMPIEVLEWTPAGVKVRLPQLEVNGVTPAEIEVIRGDGTLASKTPIDLTGGQLALNR